jgi:Subtilase family
MEGGNYAQVGTDRLSNDDLSLLTTILHPSGRLFEATRDTSPATALAARYAAIIWSRYPKAVSKRHFGSPIGLFSHDFGVLQQSLRSLLTLTLRQLANRARSFSLSPGGREWRRAAPPEWQRATAVRSTS